MSSRPTCRRVPPGAATARFSGSLKAVASRMSICKTSSALLRAASRPRNWEHRKLPSGAGMTRASVSRGPNRLSFCTRRPATSPPSGATPAYNGKMGFNPGAQTDIFVGDEGNTPPLAVVPKAGSYLGCYPDSGNPRTLSVFLQIGESMTPEVCLQKCTAYGFKYAGLEDGHECWCGETAPPSSSRVAEGKCSKQCTGSVQTCGGPYFIEIYSTGITAPLPPVPRLSVSWSTMGCFVDPVTPRALPYKQDEINGTVTIAKCLAACEHYAYAGLEFGQECYCGTTLAGVQQAPDADCNIPCAGNTPAACGGNGRLNIYSHVPGSSPSSSSVMPTTLKTSTTSKSSTLTTGSTSRPTTSTRTSSSTTTSKPQSSTPTSSSVSTNWAAPCKNLQIPHSSPCVRLESA
ncbi:WSC domain-containing protein [Cercophora newfieldiana]|uniref:WSC domain-containing protein n=1 Tax=Cercophora newfieldiana TaxID=92897 RepID=A0AA40CUC6_9PEZI|nr:WSC domain-containing protein [Cercophora newfieldiana]